MIIAERGKGVTTSTAGFETKPKAGKVSSPRQTSGVDESKARQTP